MSLSSKRIAVIEDEVDIFEVVQYNLQREGFEVIGSHNGEEGLSLIQKQHPDLVVLDLMLPGMNGLDVCRELKSNTATKSIPIIILTAKNDESDVVLGLGLGADDYLSKPFRHRELVARVQAVLRRRAIQQQNTQAEKLVRDGVVIDLARHIVTIDDEVANLTATEFRLLHFMMGHPGRVYTRDQLVNHAIGTQAVVLERNIDVHIRSIRKKLGPYRNLIETVRGVGYRFKE